MIMGQSDINKITDKLTGMKLEDNRLEYQQMFTSPWCQSEEFEKEHKNRLQKVILRRLYRVRAKGLVHPTVVYSGYIP